jgi:hypothetical protein
MLVRHYVVLIFRIQGLVVRWDVDLIIRQLVLAKVLEEISIPRPVEMHVIMVRVLGLVLVVSKLNVCCEDDPYHLMKAD